MDLNFTDQVNYLAVIVASVLYFFLGAMWYSPMLFGNKWMAALGKTKEDLIRHSIGITYILTFVGIFLAVLTLSFIFHALHISNGIEGLKVGLLLTLAFGGTTSLINSLFADRPQALFYINLGYHAVGLSLSGFIIGIWQ
ncbi:DUF1761 domain-containing protein [Solitalea sp. MAHUQ-68]|uniref:DUF1761 domain-containing protein n=1 Tax=Solitalea agri TaxID=2953739 RepID=A0A9X2EZQ3_9SPHI|nr:DUF1761 domain-containing protein [Solitalea agri]MCO4291394.1 DUF1761 domain-containing protein [Solitalea agri]